jgi:hypothetical protein
VIEALATKAAKAAFVIKPDRRRRTARPIFRHSHPEKALHFLEAENSKLAKTHQQRLNPIPNIANPQYPDMQPTAVKRTRRICCGWPLVPHAFARASPLAVSINNNERPGHGNGYLRDI